MSEAPLSASGNPAPQSEEKHPVPSALLHDLRTPLNQIIGYTEMLEEQAREEGLDDFVDDLHKVRSAGRQLVGLLEERFLPVKTSASDGDPVLAAVLEPSGSGSLRDVTGEKALQLSGLEDRKGLILVVDDIEANRDILRIRLKREGYVVEMAENGLEALEMLRQRPFDLVLLDIMMPGIDGYEVLRQVKSDEQLRHIPVIMISALSELDSVVRCIELGAEDYLPKPFNPTLLKARVTASLDKKRFRDRETLLYMQLQENYQRLQALEKMRDDLTHMIVHDLRTPLSSLLAGLQLMGDIAPIVEEQKECYDIALRGGKTLLSMINDLLDINKMESGQLALDRIAFSAAALLETSVEQVISSSREAELTLVEHVEPDVPAIVADEDKVRRVLVNLIGNAIKFTPRGGTIRVEVKRQSAGETEDALFSVADNGEGIPEDSFARIFEKFGQVESTSSRRQMSTGLGLTFCKMAVEAHGGRIWVESTMGQGSTFFFTIPLSTP